MNKKLPTHTIKETTGEVWAPCSGWVRAVYLSHTLGKTYPDLKLCLCGHDYYNEHFTPQD